MNWRLCAFAVWIDWRPGACNPRANNKAVTAAIGTVRTVQTRVTMMNTTSGPVVADGAGCAGLLESFVKNETFPASQVQGLWGRMKFLVQLLALAGAVLAFGAPGAIAQTQTGQVTIELYIDEVYEQLTGGDVVFSVSFRDPLTRNLNPAIKVHEGDNVAIKVVNRTAKSHSFGILSVPGATSAPIRAGGSAVVRFKAPPRGNYIYNDPMQGKSGDTRTLFGDFVVQARKAG
jgi:FtsP/CotA-like multicopper oxidase with cupredoxin domain